tara:strand:+ start:265 stop:900 length:636 start_codon:yes stop_codon:yes gene_type:complete
MSKTVKKTVNPLFSNIQEAMGGIYTDMNDRTTNNEPVRGPKHHNVISPGFGKFLMIISGLVALYLIIIAYVSRSKLMPALIVGLFISFILKTCFDTIKILKIIKNSSYNKLNSIILSIGIVLYIFFIYASSKLYHVLFKNIKSKCVSKIINLDALAIIYVILILSDNVILNKPHMHLFSIIVYVCVGLSMMLYYKNEIPNINNKLEDNCGE